MVEARHGRRIDAGGDLGHLGMFPVVSMPLRASDASNGVGFLVHRMDITNCSRSDRLSVYLHFIHCLSEDLQAGFYRVRGRR